MNALLTRVYEAVDKLLHDATTVGELPEAGAVLEARAVLGDITELLARQSSPERRAGAWTKGPWIARQEFANTWRIEAPNPNGPEYVPISVGLAATTILEVGCTNADTAANARLISAAPAMAEALIGVLWMAEEWFKHGGGAEAMNAEEHRAKLDAAEAALSSAGASA